MVGREWVTDQMENRVAISKFYQSLLEEPFSRRPQLVGVDFNRIPKERKSWLERLFIEEEVVEAINSLLEDKALSLDGFPIKSYLVF